jgi:hypothetical protein
MRRIVQDPLWRALDSLAKRKAAFEKWQNQLVSEKRAAREARIAELKPHLTRLFSNSGLIKSYSTMKTANKAFEKDKYWRRAKPDERREILEAYTSELRSVEETARRNLKESNIQNLTKLVRGLDITVATRWRAGHNTITHSEAFRADAQLQKMETLDILNVFDEYTHQLEKEHEEDAHRKRVEYRRRARKARDAFKTLLRELKEKGELTRTSKWKETLPRIRSDERYIAFLGLPGSSPLDLWMDAVDDLQLEAEERAAKIESQLKNATIKLETTLDEFLAMCTDSQVRETPEQCKEAFEVIHTRLARAAAEVARQEEKKRRDRIDDLRYALRKIRQIEPETTYEAVSCKAERAQLTNTRRCRTCRTCPSSRTWGATRTGKPRTKSTFAASRRRRPSRPSRAGGETRTARRTGTRWTWTTSIAGATATATIAAVIATTGTGTTTATATGTTAVTGNVSVSAIATAVITAATEIATIAAIVTGSVIAIVTATATLVGTRSVSVPTEIRNDAVTATAKPTTATPSAAASLLYRVHRRKRVIVRRARSECCVAVL